MQRAGRSVEYGREVVRDNPLGINEGATGESQLWVLVSQIRQELELSPKAEVLVTDRGVMDNFAYYLRACGMEDRFAIEPLIRSWSRTYDLVVRLLPDIALRYRTMLDRLGPGFDGDCSLGDADAWYLILEGTSQHSVASAQALAVIRELSLPPERTNPNGSGISLGHPIGATGTILAVKALYELRRTGGRYALTTMCIGGGQGIAAIFERI